MQNNLKRTEIETWSEFLEEWEKLKKLRLRGEPEYLISLLHIGAKLSAPSEFYFDQQDKIDRYFVEKIKFYLSIVDDTSYPAEVSYRAAGIIIREFLGDIWVRLSKNDGFETLKKAGILDAIFKELLPIERIQPGPRHKAGRQESIQSKKPYSEEVNEFLMHFFDVRREKKDREKELLDEFIKENTQNILKAYILAKNFQFEIGAGEETIRVLEIFITEGVFKYLGEDVRENLLTKEQFIYSLDKLQPKAMKIAFLGGGFKEELHALIHEIAFYR